MIVLLSLLIRGASIKVARQRNIRKRGKKWCVYFRIHGKQVWKTFDTKDEAELYLAQSRVKIKRGGFRQSVNVRFANFAVEWLRDYAKGNVRERTYDTYESALRNHLIPHFGCLYLTEISRKSIDRFVADWLAGGPHYQERLCAARESEARRVREERAAEAERAIAERRPARHIKGRPVRMGRSPGTISNALTPLREMLGHAVEWEYIAANPAAGVRRPRPQHREMQILDAEQIRTLLDGVDKDGDYFLPREWRTFILCAATTGMRLGELLALRWGDVDWQNRRLWVRRSITRRGTIQEPKTRGSIRAIAITPTLVSALRRHRLATGPRTDDALIFCTSRGRPFSDVNVVRRVFKPALRRAKLPEVRFHDLRHSFASLLIAQAARPASAASCLRRAAIVSVAPDVRGEVGTPAASLAGGQQSRSAAWSSSRRTASAGLTSESQPRSAALVFS
jgi:integrase